jgi:hypothetical protein
VSAGRHGWLLAFADAQALREGALLARADGRPACDVYAPCPIPGLAEPRPARRDPLPWLALAGGLLGGLGTFALETWAAVVAYPLDVGGRPDFSWPAFVPPALEMALLGAALFAVFGCLYVCGLPRWHHPAFGNDAFERASRDGFFLMLAGELDEEQARALAYELGALSCEEVPA